jgi:hypothetical protein
MNPFRLIDKALDGCGTQQDFERGWSDVDVETKVGEPHKIRVSVQSEAHRQRLISRYAQRSDITAVLPEMLPPQFATDEFMNSIRGNDIITIAHRALGVLFGIRELRRMVAEKN